MARVKGKFSVDEMLTPDAIEDIQTVIEDCGGNEVFMVGKVDEYQRVYEIEPLAFGSDDQVPAIMSVAISGDVVIHNHPSGGVSPSSADSSIAAEFAQMNIGSYIVNNGVTEIYVLFRPLPPKEYTLLDLEEIAGYFTKEGPLARADPDFEFRTEQVEMAKAVARAFNENKTAVIEAGTGVGKSFAYLIPAILWAVNNKERVVISTHTINLQEQLIHKDIPFLRDKVKLRFTSALIKGRNNYVCLRKIDMFGRERRLFSTKQHEAEAKSITEWSKKTSDGSLSELNVKPDSEVWEQFASEADNCTRLKCPYYERCFYYKSRREAAKVNLLVANHHLTMADLSIRSTTRNYGGAVVLPPFNRIIFDEGHNLESVATSYFGTRVTRFGLIRLLGKFMGKRATTRGILPSLKRAIFERRNDIQSEVFQKLMDTVSTSIVSQRFDLQDTINDVMDTIERRCRDYAIDNGICDNSGEQLKIRVTDIIRKDSLWRSVIEPNLLHISGLIDKFVLNIHTLIKEVSNLPLQKKRSVSDLLLELRTRTNRLREMSEKLRLFCSEREDLCHWIEIGRERNTRGFSPPLRFCTAPINIADLLRTEVCEKMDTTIMTSATMTVDNKFDYVLRQVGLEDWRTDSTEDKGLLLLKLDTPFSFEEQAMIGVPRDFPEPTDPRYPDHLETLILEIIKAAAGSTLVLFTSYGLMDNLYNRLESRITTLGYRCMRQGEEPRHKLLNKFRNEISSVLFATASFWEGIDVRGEALRCLILTRLPFRVPTEPILEARAEYLQRQGRDSFRELDLPWAVMKFRQGFGRLIRSKTDYGAIIITDQRLVGRSYGRVFLRSLPTKEFVIEGTVDLIEEARVFFSSHRKRKRSE